MTTEQVTQQSLTYANNDLAFAQWLDQVNRQVEGMLGFSIHDLEDRNYRMEYDDGLEPVEVAEQVLREQGM